jgi:hypothetical protein
MSRKGQPISLARTLELETFVFFRFADMCSYEYIMKCIPKTRWSLISKPTGEPGTRAEFAYHMTPATITITGKGSISVGKDLEAVLCKIEYWHQAPVTKFRILARQGQGGWHSVRWDGQTAISFPLNETDEAKAMRRCCFSISLEEARNELSGTDP